MNENPVLRVAEIEKSYRLVLKPSDRLKITSSAEAEQVFRSIWNLPFDIRVSFH